MYIYIYRVVHIKRYKLFSPEPMEISTWTFFYFKQGRGAEEPLEGLFIFLKWNKVFFIFIWIDKKSPTGNQLVTLHLDHSVYVRYAVFATIHFLQYRYSLFIYV